MSVVRVAVVQFAPSVSPVDNLSRVTALVSEAAAAGASLIVCPEYSSTFNPRLDAEVLSNAQAVSGEFVAGMGQLAKTLGVTIVFGLVEETDVPAKFANTVVVVDETGSVVAEYRKAHLYDAFGQQESDKVVAGSLTEPPVFSHRGFTVGVQTCYDLRFPEQTRWLIDAGCDFVVVPAEWVAGEHKVHHWRTLLAARAIENTCFVAAADHPGPIGIGNSRILDPLGRELAGVEDGEGFAVAECDRDLLERVRETNPSLRLRRFRVEPLP